MADSDQLFGFWDRIRLFVRRNRYLIDGRVFWQTTDEKVLRARVSAYLDEHAERLGLSRPVSLDKPRTGARTSVWFAGSGDSRVVVRAYPVARAYEAEIHREASQLLSVNGVNVPRLLNFSGNFRRHRSILVVEEYIEGTSPRSTNITTGQIQEQAVQLARLHSIRNDAWGPLGVTRHGSYFAALMQSVANSLAQLRRLGTESEPGEANRIREWFQGWENSFSEIRSYSLTHSDIHPNNGVFRPDGSYYLIDYAKMQWAVPALDVVRYYDKLCMSDPMKTGAFDKAYFPELGEPDSTTVRRLLPFYRSLYSLAFAAASFKRVRRGSSSRYSGLTEKRADHWKQLLRGVETPPPQ